MSDYDTIRHKYQPDHIRFLLIAESPPPAADIASSRQFYRSERPRTDDRLFTNTIRALYPESANLSEADLQQAKQSWLQRFQSDGWYMIEALQHSLPHEVTKPERQSLIAQNLPGLIQRVHKLASKDTKIILIKSNVFLMAAEPLRQAGFTVLNTQLLDYPGRFNQRAFREKLSKMASA